MTFSFGATSAPAGNTGGFSLGAPPAKTSAAPSFGFGSGGGATSTPTAAVAPTVGGFGAAAPKTSAPAFGGFGAPAATTQAKPVGFGLPQPQANTAPAPTFGGFGQPQPQTSTAAPAFGGFGLGAPAATTTSAAPSFGGFGAPAATASVAPTLGGFGAATTSAAPPAFGFATATATSSSATAAPPSFGGFGATTSTTTATVSGLGGNTNAGGLLGSQAGKPAASGEENKTDGSSSKESPIPAELNTTVEAFKNFIKEEKSLSSEISHNTDKQMKQVKEDTEGLSHLVSSISSTLQSNRLKLDQLKQSCGQELVNVDICVKTRDTPASMQYDNVAPMGYFSRLVAQFEQSMLDYRQAIQSSELHLESLSSGSSLLSAEDIVAAVQRLHQAMTHLAAKYQVVHTAITQLKCEYQVQSRRSAAPPAALAGPSPFTAPADPLTRARQSISGTAQAGPPIQSLGTQQAAFGQFGANTAAFNSSTNTFGGNNSSTMFGAANTSFAANTSVNIGTKRNKH